ncbi:hypothetical protein VE00_06339 [Pseudogymnoascus sp. WSF 3629]|nr:hypothetical protein VE00_06339 [Pseudogymnoascus sp. WSF 3629]
MWKWIEKLLEKLKAIHYAHIILIAVIITSVLSMVGCVSRSPGIPELFIAELPGSKVQFGYVGICSTVNATVCTPAIGTPPADLATMLSVSIDVVHHVLALQQSVSLALPALSGILITCGYFAFWFAWCTKSEKSVKSRRRWIATTRILLWGAVGAAFAAAYLLAFSISAMEVVAPAEQPKSSTGLAVKRESSAGLAVKKGSRLQMLQWAVFSVTALFVSTIHYMLHKIVKEVRDGILPKVEPRTGDTAAAGSGPKASTGAGATQQSGTTDLAPAGGSGAGAGAGATAKDYDRFSLLFESKNPFRQP